MITMRRRRKSSINPTADGQLKFNDKNEFLTSSDVPSEATSMISVKNLIQSSSPSTVQTKRTYFGSKGIDANTSSSLSSSLQSVVSLSDGNSRVIKNSNTPKRIKIREKQKHCVKQMLTLNHHNRHRHGFTWNSIYAVTLILWFYCNTLCDGLMGEIKNFQNEPAIYASYATSNKSINFKHLTFDPITGRIYVGAINWIYQFSSDLTLEVALQTGPVEDSPNCSPSGCTGQDTNNMKLTKNVNKVLVIDPQSRMLIACGSVHQGSCKRHKLDDIKQGEPLVPLPVASNDENSSTIAFVGSARYFGDAMTSVLYVAATKSRLGSYRDVVPAISSRYLEPGPRLFNIIEKSFSDSALVDINFQVRDYFLVKYIYGFQSGDFVYFATVQRKSHLRALEEWGYVTRLARVCVSDAAYNTYTEVTLQCLGADGTDYTLLQDAVIVRTGTDLAKSLHIDYKESILMGVFATSQDHTSRPSRRSAMCVFPLSEIENKFTENMHLCFNGSVLTRDMDYIAGSIQSCPEPGKSGNIVSFCSETLKLNGSIPITSYAVFTEENSTLTAVTSVTVAQHTVSFIGTSDGHLKKLLVSRGDFAEEFEDIKVDPGHSILPDIFVDKTHQYVYASSPYKLSKVRIEGCSEYKSCFECLEARNPYCGWCSLEKRCSAKSECDDNSSSSWGLTKQIKTSRRWLHMESQCIGFEEIKPSHIPLNSMSMVELVINQLPPLPYGANYLCVFGPNTTPIQARQTLNGLTCSTPPLNERPSIMHGEDHISVNLAVKSTVTSTNFIQHSFVFFDCSLHKTCRNCVTSPWACNWCLHENLCTNNASTSCTRKVILGESSDEKWPNKGREFCPSFNIDEEILIPNGAKREIEIKVRNLVTSVDGFVCIFEIEDARTPVLAHVQDGKVICDANEFTYEAEVPEMRAQLTVLWNGDTFIDKTNFTLYKCHLFGSHDGKTDCSLCQATNKRYQCVWCSGQCSYVDTCHEYPALSCPPPRIDWIRPLSGPMEGGTMLIIKGSNLGSSEDEIKDKITIGGIPCVPYKYTVSVQVVCRTGPTLAGPHSAVILFGNSAGVTQASEKFQYKMVQLTDVMPKLGPKSGGTRLILSGSNLNIGSSVEIFLDALPCLLEESLLSSQQLICRTTASSEAPYSVKKLTLVVDGANLTLENPFTYVPDPYITRISPLHSFISGGRSLTVFGSGFSAIQQPKMVLYNLWQNFINETICQVMNETAIICPSPGVNNEAKSRSLFLDNDVDSNKDELKFRIGFKMDDVQHVKELEHNFPELSSQISYVPDPKFFHFKLDGIKLYKGESLVIEGENLRLAATELEVNVTIGTRPCNLTSLSMTQLVCLPPDVQPPETDEFGRRTANDLPAVVVRVGNTLRFKVGYLRYEVAASYEVPPLIIGLISGLGALVMLLSLIMLAIFRHKSSQAKREYKRIQLQMDSLENSVRLECKQAFAELQTDMTDLAYDILASGIPILDHRNYTMKIFFPGLIDNPLCGSYKLLNGHSFYGEQTMIQFEELINNKSFLLAFINTLENQSSFSIRDRVNVASLLTIILIDKMDYALDILRELLLKLIEKYANSKHPQLLLRRTEYVVEKMLTNWMALCMYDYIKDEAGKSLFLLFNAIRHQIEKGPIDAITHDARYSLSEERLLREQIEYSVVIIHVIQDGLPDKFQCRVLDCDTISQIKNKILETIYKNTPVSQRPTCHDVDLEWRDGSNGRLIISDEDITTKQINGWKRLNTLTHYGIRDQAVMSLIFRRNDPNNHLYKSISSSPNSSPVDQSNSHYSHIYYTLNKKSPINRNSTKSCDNNARTWHLVRSSDELTRSRDQSPKAIPEIFLTRLLSTKGTVQKYVDDFFAAVLSVNQHLPIAVKWLFDLFDEAAMEHGISDPEVIHSWKSNSLPLRFWVNLVKNPDYIFDIDKSPAVDSCLSVIAQAFMDSCLTSEHRLGKESPSSKLLFARDMPAYRKMVGKFYNDVSELPRVSDEHILSVMRNISATYAGEVDTKNALRELYVYVARYREEL